MLTVIRGLFENALKTNINLEKGYWLRSVFVFLIIKIKESTMIRAKMLILTLREGKGSR
ncbi:MAG: hypothetical protein ACI4VX_07830 [Succinivibrionaceae bacterium]